MTLNEIKKAVDEGKTVCWKQNNYVVEKWKESYEIVCKNNKHAVGLQRKDNGEPTHDLNDFYIKGELEDFSISGFYNFKFDGYEFSGQIRNLSEAQLEVDYSKVWDERKQNDIDYINFDYFQKEAYEKGLESLKKRLLGDYK